MSEANDAKCPSKRMFLITCNEEDKFGDVLNYLRSLNPGYLVAAREKAPTTGHIHMHAFVQFPNNRRLSIKKLLGSHLDVCRGSPQQNEKYVKKDGDIIAEEGKLKPKGGYTIKEVKEMTKEQRNELPLIYSNIIKRMNEEEGNMLTVNDIYKPEVKVHWYWGESGAGKTRYAMKEIGERPFNMVKYEQSFWHGVNENSEVALYDDWRDGQMKPVELINFIDYYIHPMNVKGGSVKNRYKEIYITSLQNPEEIYKNVPEETKKQWMRRIKEIIKFEIEK